MNDDKQPVYAYEWDCGPGIVHRDFQYSTYNGRYPDRTLTLYAESPAPSPVSGADERAAVEFYAMNPSAAVADLRKRIAPTGQQALSREQKDILDALWNRVSTSPEEDEVFNAILTEQPKPWLITPAAPQAVALTDEQWEELRGIARTYNKNGFPKYAREFFARVLLAAAPAPATADARDEVSGECFVVIGHGESDIPEAKIVARREELPDAVLGMIFGDSKHAPADVRAEYTESLADEDEWSADQWSVDFEIGGVHVWHVGLHPIDARAAMSRSDKS